MTAALASPAALTVVPPRTVSGEMKVTASASTADAERDLTPAQRAKLNALAPTAAHLAADPTLLEPPKPLIPHFAWQGRITLYSAPDKGGKSTLLTSAVAAASNGAQFLSQQIAGPQRVLWLCLEEHQGDLLRRLQFFNANLASIRVVAFPSDPTLALKEAVALWSPDIVVVDTLVRYAAGKVKQGGDAQQWSPLLQDLIRLARSNGCAILLAHHARRGDGEARDSGDITAAADVVIEQKARHTNGRQSFAVRGRWAMEDFSILLRDRVYHLADLRALPIAEKICAFISKHPGCTTTSVRDGVKGKSATKSEALKELEAAGRIINMGSEGHDAWHVVESGA